MVGRREVRGLVLGAAAGPDSALAGGSGTDCVAHDSVMLLPATEARQDGAAQEPVFSVVGGGSIDSCCVGCEHGSDAPNGDG